MGKNRCGWVQWDLRTRGERETAQRNSKMRVYDNICQRMIIAPELDQLGAGQKTEQRGQ